MMLFPITLSAQSVDDIAVPLSNPGQPGKLQVGLIHGDIHIVGYDGQDVLISYDDDERDGRSNRRNNSNRRGLRRIPNTSVGLEASERNNEVRISVSGVPKSIDLEIKVPRNFSLKVSTVNDGDITIENVNGEFEVSNVNGDVEMTNMGGSALVNTVNGDIDIDFTSIDEDAPMSFTTVNGDIDLAVPASAKFDVKMKTEWGEIFTDFEFEAVRNNQGPRTSRRSGQYKVTVDKWVTGAINGGGPEYLFKSLHGDLIIRKN